MASVETHVELARFFDTVERMVEQELLESHFALLDEAGMSDDTKPIRGGIYLFVFSS